MGGATRRNAVAALLALAAAGLAGVPAAPATSGPHGSTTATTGTTGTGTTGAQSPWLATAQLQPDEGGPAAASPRPGPAGAGTDSQTDGGGETVWTPPTPLPEPAPGARRVDIVLSPHPDDETLSLGVWVANAAARGDRVIVVALSDGRSTGAVTTVSARLGKPVTRDRIAVARLRELDDAAARLGVRHGDVYPAHLDTDDSPGGSRITEPEVLAVIRAFATRFPGATFATMSWAAERHPDHLDAGRALRSAAGTGLVTRAVFAVSRLWWTLPSPPTSEVLPSSQAVRRRVLAAAEAYDRWDPADDRLAIGWTSVRSQFTALMADPRDRIHH